MEPPVRVRSHDPGDPQEIIAARKPAFVTLEEDRAYREGQVNERLRGHDEHLKRINGSIDRTGAALEAVARNQDRMQDQLTGLVIAMPKIQTIAEQVEKAEVVDAALRQKRIDDRTFWDSNRSYVAWGIGIIAVLTSTASTWLKLFGVG